MFKSSRMVYSHMNLSKIIPVSIAPMTLEFGSNPCV